MVASKWVDELAGDEGPTFDALFFFASVSSWEIGFSGNVTIE